MLGDFHSLSHCSLTTTPEGFIIYPPTPATTLIDEEAETQMFWLHWTCDLGCKIIITWCGIVSGWEWLKRNFWEAVCGRGRGTRWWERDIRPVSSADQAAREEAIGRPPEHLGWLGSVEGLCSFLPLLLHLLPADQRAAAGHRCLDCHKYWLEVLNLWPRLPNWVLLCHIQLRHCVIL